MINNNITETINKLALTIIDACFTSSKALLRCAKLLDWTTSMIHTISILVRFEISLQTLALCAKFPIIQKYVRN